ncbi:MAG: hypothetical protein HZB70_01860 [Candidatus Berkelbacteria bacterium]|nr:MAG: hypothetical protein HZB70_01860 [Candidatus Berkelbacteria bacterium]QQG51931.1 MAG: hypothetical protein HY845_01135 [Candidatus Berkelbacteria bacterium]
MTPQKFSNAVLALSVLVLLLGISTYWQSNAEPNLDSKTSVTERDAALSRARIGDGTYSFSTSFIPGLGYIGSAEQTRQKFKQDNKGAITNQ